MSSIRTKPNYPPQPLIMKPTPQPPSPHYSQDPTNPTYLNPKPQLSAHNNSKQGKGSVNVNVNNSEDLGEDNTMNSDIAPKHKVQKNTLFTPITPDNADTKSNKSGKGQIRISTKSPALQRAPRGKSYPKKKAELLDMPGRGTGGKFLVRKTDSPGA